MTDEIKLILSCNRVYRMNNKLYRFHEMSDDKALKMAKDTTLSGVYFFSDESPVDNENLFKHIIKLASHWVYEKLDDYGNDRIDFVVFSKIIKVDDKKVTSIGIRYKKTEGGLSRKIA